MASQLMTTPFSAKATFSAKADLPEAVGPAITKTVFSALLFVKRTPFNQLIKFLFFARIHFGIFAF